MRRARLSRRDRRVLAAVEQASSGGRTWVSGYDVFDTLRTSSGVLGANHGRAFHTLRSLSRRDLLGVRIEPPTGSRPSRVAYRLPDPADPADSARSATTR